MKKAKAFLHVTAMYFPKEERDGAQSHVCKRYFSVSQHEKKSTTLATPTNTLL